MRNAVIMIASERTRLTGNIHAVVGRLPVGGPVRFNTPYMETDFIFM